MSKKNYQRFRYSEKTLDNAITEIKSGNLSLNKASEQYGIPKSTLHNKLTNKVPNIRKMGPPPILTSTEEKRIEAWILAKAKLGFPMHPDEVKDAVKKILQDIGRANPFTDDRPGEKWLKLFLGRHPQIARKNTEIISKSRASVTEESIRVWFSDLQTFLQNENIFDMIEDPSRVFNADETGIRTCMKSGLVLAPKGYKNLYEVSSGSEKESITVLCNYSAAGIVAPPMVMFPYKRIPKELALSVPEGWAIGRSDSGWMTAATFYEYIANVFYPWLVNNNIKFPVIMFIDGHKSHYNMELYEFCREKQITLYCLPPNSTHILQPCDVSIFRPLKTNWRAVVRRHKQNTGCTITRHNFCSLFKEAFETSAKLETIVNGFRVCGLHPFNPDAVDYTKCISWRRKDIFSNDSTDHQVTPEDFRTSLRVLEKFVGASKIRNYKVKSINNDDAGDDELYWFWKFCESNGLTETQNQMQNSTHYVEENLNNIPFEINGVLYEDLTVTNEETSTIQIDYDVSNDPGIKKECQEIIEMIIETVFEIVDQAKKPIKINITSNVIISPSCESSKDPWSHLHWPKPIDLKTKRKAQGAVMPYAITSKNWAEFHNEQERKKKEKEKTLETRKAERELKKKERLENKNKNIEKNAKKRKFEGNVDNITKKTKQEEIAEQEGNGEQHTKTSEQMENAKKEENCEKQKPLREDRKFKKEKYGEEQPTTKSNEDKKAEKEENNEEHEVVKVKKEEYGKQQPTMKSKKDRRAETEENSEDQQIIKEDKKENYSVEHQTKKSKHARNSEKDNGQQQVEYIDQDNIPDIFNVGDYVLVEYELRQYPGLIKNCHDDEYEISVMEQTTKKRWKWPKPIDQIWYKKTGIKKKISAPVPCNTRGIFNVDIN